MRTLLTKAGLGMTLAATALTAAAPADAQWRRGYHRDRGGNAGTAVVAGIAGIAIGAALASNGRDRYRDRYYADRGYYPNDGYYADRYRDYRRCWVERRYDPYYDQTVRVRVCN